MGSEPPDAAPWDRMRPPKDRDFVETLEGLLFCLVGYVHPPDRYTAYLKYTPAETGKWARDRVFYCRNLPYYHVRNVVATLEFLERHHPRYVWLDPVRGLRFSFVPKDAVATYYVPEDRLAEIMEQPHDPLEEQVRDLVDVLASAAGIPVGAMGVTGSILLKLHDPSFSDIDVTVYGRENALKVKRAVEVSKGRLFEALEPERRERWRTETAERFALSREDVAHLETRRWNYFLFRGRYVSVHPTKRDDEIRERYGDERSRIVGVASIEATVVEAGESLFLPAVYRLGDVSVLDGPVGEIREIVSFEGLYGDIADPGDRIVARGQVEELSGGSRRLVVGTSALADGGFVRVKRALARPL